MTRSKEDFRKAAGADVPLLIELRRKAIMAQPETYWNAEQKIRAADYWNHLDIGKNFANHEAYIYLRDGEVAGFTAWSGSYLSALFLLPEFQNSGSGTIMLKFAEDKIKHQHDHIWLFAHPYAERFYERHGFMKQPETEDPFGTGPLYKFLKSFI